LHLNTSYVVFDCYYTAGSPSHQHCTDYRVRATVVGKLQTIIALTEKWCIGKAKQFLRSYKVAPFVVLTHGDLVVSISCSK